MNKGPVKFVAFAIIATAYSTGANAQETQNSPAQSGLAQADISTLRQEVDQRYDRALAATLDTGRIQANDSRYIWASEAKVQCGIAKGFLKSGTRDPESIRKCEQFSALMDAGPPPVIARPPEPPAPICTREDLGMIFFEFDSVIPSAEVNNVVQYIATNAPLCGWDGYDVVGNTDTSGSDGYNDALSIRRANAVADMMANAGIPRVQLNVRGDGERVLKIQTPDGTKNPTNRRVEVTIKE